MQELSDKSLFEALQYARSQDEQAGLCHLGTEEIPAVPTLAVGDKTHPIDSLSDITKAQITNLQIVEAEIRQL